MSGPGRFKLWPFELFEKHLFLIDGNLIPVWLVTVCTLSHVNVENNQGIPISNVVCRGKCVLPKEAGLELSKDET